VKDNVCFDEALGKLEMIVKQLERGELPLEESLDRFAEGMKLSQVCLNKLDQAEKKIDKIIQVQQGKIIEKPLKMLGEKEC
jgi:exodeoxyribonuclease VII small subunit